jgi:hypothetical protein
MPTATRRRTGCEPLLEVRQTEIKDRNGKVIETIG